MYCMFFYFENYYIIGVNVMYYFMRVQIRVNIVYVNFIFLVLNYGIRKR